MTAHPFPGPDEIRGVEHAAVIDLMTHDPQTDEVEIVMFEPRPWDAGEAQLYELQEKMNAYLSFALDGELADTYPQLVGKPLRVVLRCRAEPPAPAVEFLAAVREQIALQGIDLEVRYAEPGEDAIEGTAPSVPQSAPPCGACGCHPAG